MLEGDSLCWVVLLVEEMASVQRICPTCLLFSLQESPTLSGESQFSHFSFSGCKKFLQSVCMQTQQCQRAAPSPPFCYNSVVVTWVTSERSSSPLRPWQPRWGLPTSSHAGLLRASEAVQVGTCSRVVLLAREKLFCSTRARKGRQNSLKHLLKFSSRKA